MNALQRLSVRPLLTGAPEPIRAIHVSRRGDFGRVLLSAQEAGLEDFGAVVPASVLGRALSGALQAQLTTITTSLSQAAAGAGNPGLTHLAPARLLALDCGGDSVTATIESSHGPQKLRASVVVGADGAGSLVAAQTGLAAESHDYGQEAVVFAAGCSRAHEGVAYERFTDDGALAALPLPGRRVGLVWTRRRQADDQAADVASAGPMPDAPAVLAQVQAQFGQRLGRLHSPGPCARFPLLRRWAAQTVSGRVVLIGNAAQTLHPIAAQGFNLGLRDALVLAESLLAAGNNASGLASALAAYQTRRAPDRQRIADLSHALARWPKVSLPGLGLVRSLGFAALNASTGLRQSLMLAGMGFSQDAPAAVLEPAVWSRP
ncbi:MAG: FAD-dependent monooxygenase, partial [Lysobacterales bacterium]